MSLKRDIFVNFLLQKFMTKYGLVSTYSVTFTGGIEKFSAKENFGKILKVSHFYLGFSWNEGHNKIKHSYQVSSEFSESYRISLVFSNPVLKKTY